MTSTRRYSLAAGLLFLLTHVTSIPALLFYAPVLNDPRYIAGHASDTSVLVGVLLEVILALANIGTAVALFPVTRRRHEAAAIGYVGLRTLESAVIAAGVLPLLAIVALKQHAGPADAAALVPIGQSLLALHHTTFLVGPGMVCAANTFVLAWLLHRARLVPRAIPTLGMIAGPLVFMSSVAVLFGVVPQLSVPTFAAAMPALAWELSLAGWLIFRGLNDVAPQAVTCRTQAAIA